VTFDFAADSLAPQAKGLPDHVTNHNESGLESQGGDTAPESGVKGGQDGVTWGYVVVGNFWWCRVDSIGTEDGFERIKQGLGLAGSKHPHPFLLRNGPFFWLSAEFKELIGPLQ
jgi:hypothetical protein